jgi:hypothetical protein
MEYSRLKEEHEQEEEMDIESILLYNMFPNAKFTISMDYDEMDKIITQQPSIIVIMNYDCYCYSKNKRKTEYYYIKGKNITNKYVIQSIIEQGFNPGCNHRFLEGFMKMNNSKFKFEILLGS